MNSADINAGSADHTDRASPTPHCAESAVAQTSPTECGLCLTGEIRRCPRREGWETANAPTAT